MDLTILHYLESFREGSGAFLNDFFVRITNFFGISVLPIFIAIVYWCINKSFGTYLLLGFQWNRFVNGLAKISVCAYRPWIRDPSIIPDPVALKGATGYSFPSGHSTNVATLFGGVGVRKDMTKGLRIAAWFVVCLVGFSRLFVSVHTPQDVLFGLLIGSLVMYATFLLMPKITKSKCGDIITAVVSIALSILVGIYASMKTYPVDYDSAGQLLVDGHKMAKDTFTGIGWNVGFFVGWIIERRFVKFSSEGSVSSRVLRLICGVLGYYFVCYAILPLILKAIAGNMGLMVGCFFQMLYIVLLFPICIKLGQKK